MLDGKVIAGFRDWKPRVDQEARTTVRLCVWAARGEYRPLKAWKSFLLFLGGWNETGARPTTSRKSYLFGKAKAEAANRTDQGPPAHSLTLLTGALVLTHAFGGHPWSSSFVPQGTGYDMSHTSRSVQGTPAFRIKGRE